MIDIIIVVYFFYGLSFFCMGLSILLEIGHPSELDFAHALRPLAGFGLVHGSHEWFEMFLLIFPGIAANPANWWIGPLRLILLASSFLMLVAFGARLIAGPSRRRLKTLILLSVTAVWVSGLFWVMVAQPPGQSKIIAADVYTRYSLAIPGAVLTAWGLILQQRRFIKMGMPVFGRDMLIAALAFGLYGAVGQLFASPSAIFPSAYLNNQIFLRWFGFPVQLLRATASAVIAIAIIHSLRAFEVENRKRLQDLRNAQLAEQKRLELLRAELLHRTVKAQEAERQRIARELHDETGQSLTALAMGLHSLAETIPSHPQKAIQNARQLEELAENGIGELQRLVSGLHPPQLDDLGLIAALRWYIGEMKNRFGLDVHLETKETVCRIPAEMRTVLFRVAQEALTNTVRHSNATRAVVYLSRTEDEVNLRVEDNGQGFDVRSMLAEATDQPCWGLLGMIERASLVDGECKIQSAPGQGTVVQFRMPLEAQKNG